jgi:hypothetical protein
MFSSNFCSLKVPLGEKGMSIGNFCDIFFFLLIFYFYYFLFGGSGVGTPGFMLNKAGTLLLESYLQSSVTFSNSKKELVCSLIVDYLLVVSKEFSKVLSSKQL